MNYKKLVNLIGKEITLIDQEAGKVYCGTLQNSPNEEMMFVYYISKPRTIRAAFKLDWIISINGQDIYTQGSFS